MATTLLLLEKSRHGKIHPCPHQELTNIAMAMLAVVVVILLAQHFNNMATLLPLSLLLLLLQLLVRV
jgi:hypothetical protein